MDKVKVDLCRFLSGFKWDELERHIVYAHETNF